jgi:hypothetical protein
MSDCNTNGLPIIEAENGADGFHAFNRLSAAFSQPAVGDTITISVYNQGQFSILFAGLGMILQIPSVGYFLIEDVNTTNSTMTITRIQGYGEMPEATVGVEVNLGSFVYVGNPAGPPGTDGDPGPSGENGLNGFIVHASTTTPTSNGTSTSWETLYEADVTELFAVGAQGEGFLLSATFDMQNAPNTTAVLPVSVRVAMGPDVGNARVLNKPDELPFGGVLYVVTGNVIGGPVAGRTGSAASGGRLHMRVQRNQVDGITSDGWFIPDGEPQGSDVFDNIPTNHHVAARPYSPGTDVNQIDLSGDIKVFIQYKRNTSQCDLIKLLTASVDTLTKEP